MLRPLIALIVVSATLFAADTAATIGTVISPGNIGEARCLAGARLIGTAESEKFLIEANGTRYSAVAIPDRASQRVLVKVVATAPQDSKIKPVAVDGYLQGQDGKPGLPAEFHLADNSLTVGYGTTGNLILLRSMVVN